MSDPQLKGPYPLHSFSSPNAKIMADLCGVAADLKFVIDVLTRWLAVEDDPLLENAYFSSAMSAYRRCFNSGVRNGLTRDDVVLIGNGAEAFPDYLISQANKLIAHSVNPFELTTIGIMVVDEKIAGVGFLSGRLIGLDKDGIAQWGSLAKTIGNNILNPRIDAARTIVQTEAEIMSAAEIPKRPFFGTRCLRQKRQS